MIWKCQRISDRINEAWHIHTIDALNEGEAREIMAHRGNDAAWLDSAKTNVWTNEDHGWSCLNPDHNHPTEAEADACVQSVEDDWIAR